MNNSHFRVLTSRFVFMFGSVFESWFVRRRPKGRTTNAPFEP
jgi:hypothetical protein